MDGPPLGARPRTPDQPDLFGDEKAGSGDTPGTGDAQPTRAPARRSITVPSAGLCERAVRDVLGCTSAEINAHTGGVDLGSPRDYRWAGTGYVFTLAGVRRLVALLHLDDVDVFAEGEARPEPAGPRRRQRGPWWLADQSEGDR